ncbi:MAG: sulfite exporter TauE/SafE family protein [Bacteroidetes bacterium]|nr:MAG: sulfite exporter TauE/SafE family protein [Bacteroidota bacterium]
MLLIGTGLALLGWLRMPAGRLGAGWRRLVGTMAAFLRDPTPGRIWALGLLNGLLPCGLVYAALAAATASGTALRGAFLMAVFGLATVPALLVLGSTGVLMRPAWRVRLQRAGAVLVILLGLLTLVRGFPGLHAGGHGQAAHDTPREHVH